MATSGARREIDLKMKEADFQRLVIEAAELNGWLVYHTYDSRRCEPGFPDLVLVRGDTLIFAELKSVRGRLSPEQKLWIGRLEKVKRILVQTWKPHDWRDIEWILTNCGRFQQKILDYALTCEEGE